MFVDSQRGGERSTSHKTVGDVDVFLFGPSIGPLFVRVTYDYLVKDTNIRVPRNVGPRRKIHKDPLRRRNPGFSDDLRSHLRIPHFSSPLVKREYLTVNTDPSPRDRRPEVN